MRRGIGKALTEQLCSRGWKVLATGRDNAVYRLQAENGCWVERADLSQPAAAVALFKKALSYAGQLDALVNNAGINPHKKPIQTIELAEWEAQMALNLRAPMLLCREALCGMKKGGHIMNVISTIALTSQANYAIYAASKYGLMGFTHTLRKEAREAGIKVTAVYPGGTDSDFRPERTPQSLCTYAFPSKSILSS